MAEQNNQAAKAAVGVSVGAAVLAALALLQRPASAASPGETVEIPEELWNLIIAIAQSADDIDAGVKGVIEALGNLAINVQGFPPNAESITAVRVECQVINQPYRLPSLEVPDGMPLHLLAWPLNPPAGLIFIGPSASGCSNMNQSYPMPPGATKDYYVKNAEALWVCATAVPAWVVATAEQRRS